MMSRRWKFVRPSRIAVTWVAALAAAAALEVWLHLQSTEVGYQLSALHRVIDRLNGERSELEVELATLTSPGSLDTVARARLGLKPPRDGQIVGMP